MESYEKENLILQSICPTNEILIDQNGRPSVMVKIPKMTLTQLRLGESDAVHPAFIVNGKEVDAVYIGKYDASFKDGAACSLPSVDPAAKVTFREALAACEAKGRGWHLMTKAEFALIAQLCVIYGCLPAGNNSDGRDYREEISRAIPTMVGRTATGTGPLSWYHDGTIAGIADLNGNVSDWVGGIRLFKAEIQVLPGNDAADSRNSQMPDSDCWMAINGLTGEYAKPDGNGTTPNSVKLEFNDRYAEKSCGCGWRYVTELVAEEVNKKRGDAFANTHCDSNMCEKAKELLRSVGMLPAGTNPNVYEHCKLWANNGGEDLRCHCGGSYHDYADAGVFFTRLCDGPDKGSNGVGFRCAYVKLPD